MPTVFSNDGWCDVVQNDGRGDCLFQSIAQQLDGINALQLRQVAVNYLQEHLEEFLPQLTELGFSMRHVTREIPIDVPEDAIPTAVLGLLRLPWTWGGAECIAAISRHYNRDILVYMEDGDMVPFRPADGGVEAPVRIMHRFNNRQGIRTHYESVIAVRPLDLVSCHHHSLLL